MKRWEVVALPLVIGEEAARLVCMRWHVNPDSDMDAPPATLPAPDLGRDIAAALLIGFFHANYRPQLAEWERLTGRKG